MRERLLFLSAHNTEDPEGDKRTERFLDILLEKYDIDLLEYSQAPRELPFKTRPSLMLHPLGQARSRRNPLFAPLNKLRGNASAADTDKNLRAEIAGLGRIHNYKRVFITHTLLWKCLDMVSALLPDAAIVTDAYRLKNEASAGRSVGPRGITKHYQALQAALNRREARKLVNKASLLLTSSEWDALYLKSLSFADAGKVHAVPAYIDLEEYDCGEAVVKEESIVLNWNMRSVEGKNAALVFFRKIYPAIKEKVPACRCYLLGDGMHPEVAALVKDDSSVAVFGSKREADHYIRRARAVIALLREGIAGQSEILEAWALRTPVITSRKGSEALHCEPGRNILLAGTTGEIAEHVVKLLEMPELGSIIADQAYRTLLNHYEADQIRTKVLSLI
ncbi:glycosyltransferase family 4 protein [Paenibacillus tengchongensis]|uniref:glycosyltransferase family 4 protein n=1 Tax=Paenibacillus tengchongensis TaxID=2608684 RepID=UPI00124CFC2E|nr:glycosyltransferase family 4 protein [Paenibacillus tengchongensis]